MLCLAASASAQEAVIRRVLPQRIPQIGTISAVNPSPIPGLYEVVVGPRIIYTDAGGEHIFEGTLIATQGRRNLTQERLEVVNAIDFKDLPLDLAIVNKFGNGARKLVVFADPNCGYCKWLERETFPKLKDVTVYTILVPMLSPDSHAKSKALWCAKEPAKAWTAWITQDIAPPPAPADCDGRAIETAQAYARSKGIQATPTMVFQSGKRIPGAMPAERAEALLAEAK